MITVAWMKSVCWIKLETVDCLFADVRKNLFLPIVDRDDPGLFPIPVSHQVIDMLVAWCPLNLFARPDMIEREKTNVTAWSQHPLHWCVLPNCSLVLDRTF
jgi:hypothetical protein